MPDEEARATKLYRAPELQCLTPADVVRKAIQVVVAQELEQARRAEAEVSDMDAAHVTRPPGGA
ncbi:MAG: hypothetical protein L0387_42385 [Acidobacteria bacterium]|nr:hypothetical protein [Acidobacteriota bacterium]